MIVNTTGEVVGGGSGRSYETRTEVIMGGLDRVYGSTPDNYIGAYSQWTSIDDGKSFADYDEIILVCKAQNTPAYGTKIFRESTEISLLSHYDKVCRYFYPEGGTTNYCKYGLDYTNNKFYLENWNYLCPIALVGVKYCQEVV